MLQFQLIVVAVAIWVATINGIVLCSMYRKYQFQLTWKKDNNNVCKIQWLLKYFTGRNLYKFNCHLSKTIAKICHVVIHTVWYLYHKYVRYLARIKSIHIHICMKYQFLQHFWIFCTYIFEQETFLAFLHFVSGFLAFGDLVALDPTYVRCHFQRSLDCEYGSWIRESKNLIVSSRKCESLWLWVWQLDRKI